MIQRKASLKVKDLPPQKVRPQMKLRCAIYARVSTDDKGQDPLNQLLQLREFATRQGWEIVTEYTDEATAKNGDRKGFKALFTDAARRRFDVLLFWSLDRLTREGTFKTHCYLKQLTDAGVKFKSFHRAVRRLARRLRRRNHRAARGDGATRTHTDIDRTKAGIARRRPAGGLEARA